MEVINKNEYNIVPNGHDCTIYKTQNNDCVITQYKVFKGIKLLYYDVNSPNCPINFCSSTSEIISINHCREGRFEFEYCSGEFMYISSGDLCIQKHSSDIKHICCPLGHYQGVSIVIDLCRVPKFLSCIMEDVKVSPAELCKKFCSGSPYTVMRENDSIKHIFSELYSVPEEIKTGYFKVKVLELLLFLSAIRTEEKERRKHYSLSQVKLAKQAKKYLLENIDRHVTIEELSNTLFVSKTSLKNCFKGVYGETIYGFIKNYKMEHSALLLKKTDKSVLEIASEVGYENSSKYSSAFKKLMGLTPNEYRKQIVCLERQADL